MEITEKTLTERLNSILSLQENNDEWVSLTERMKEKGVECAIIIPVIDVFMNFNPILDIAFQESSKTVNDQRFDFLVDRKIVVEAKKLEANLNDHIDQICQYMTDNNIEFGILTNGFDYWFFLKRKYIERIANEGKEIDGLSRDQQTILVMKVFVDPQESGTCDFFSKIMRMFAKDKYEETFKKIAQYALSIITFTKKRGVTLHKDKDVNDYLQKTIEEAINYDKGSFFSEWKDGTYKEGDELFYEDEIIKISVIIQKNGIIKYPNKGLKIKDFNKMRETKEYEPLIDLLSKKWDYQETVYSDYKDIFRKITGKKSIHKKYQFIHG